MPLVSVDLWGTLIKSSPFFSQKKIELVRKYFPGIADDYILDCFSETKKQLNQIIEYTGYQPTELIMYNLLFGKLESKYSLWKFMPDFIEEYQEIAIEFNPILYSDETSYYLSKFAENNRLIISSNTMFINSNSLRKILHKLDIKKYFELCLFSDEVKHSKPNREMYHYSDYHIGDNPLTDYIGAELAGSKPFLINSNDKTIKDAYNFVTKTK